MSEYRRDFVDKFPFKLYTSEYKQYVITAVQFIFSCVVDSKFHRRSTNVLNIMLILKRALPDKALS